MVEEKISDEEILAKIQKEYDYDQMMKLEKDVETPEQKESHFRLIREILNSEKSTKVADLSPEELGQTRLSMRGSLFLELLCNTVGIDELAECYKLEAEIIASTSMAKHVKGSNFLNLIFTQIRKHISGSMEQPGKKKWSFFKKGDDGG